MYEEEIYLGKLLLKRPENQTNYTSRLHPMFYILFIFVQSCLIYYDVPYPRGWKVQTLILAT